MTHIYDNLQNLFTRIFMLVVVPFALAGCATPVAPSGGPPDRTGPIVINTTPSPGTVNFDGSEVRFEFNEYVDRNSARQNVSIEPNLDIEFDVRFRRRTVIVEFIDPLPENTTIVVQLGTDVTDTHRNKMAAAYTLPLSTGPVLDDGTVKARLRHAERGSVEQGERVFLYRSPSNLLEPARYVAQSDTAGNIKFTHLREGTYTALWVDDVNRDRVWNRDRERAIPFHTEEFTVLQGEERDLGTLYIQRPDTVSPRVNGVGLLSKKRLRLRLSEEVHWDENAFLTVVDSLGNDFTKAWPLYRDRSDRQVMFAQTEQPLPEENRFTLKSEGISDRAGNRLRTYEDPFAGSAEPDTTFLRYISDNSRLGLFPDQPVEVRYSKFIASRVITDSLLVFEGDSMIEDWEHLEVKRNILKIHPDETWRSGTRYQFRVWDPDLQDHISLEPDIWQRNQLGSIEFNIADETGKENRLILWDENRRIEIDTTFTGSLEVEDLPPLQYHAIVFRDLNESGRWDYGSVDPYEAPEPYFLRRNIPVREGFTSEVSVVFVPDQRDTEIPDFPGEEEEETETIESENGNEETENG